MKTDAETNLAGVKKAAEDASGGVNTTTVTNWGNSASEVKKNLDKMKQTANLKLGEMQKTVESHFSGQYNTMTKKWEKACERIGQLITQMVRSTKDSLNGFTRNMNTIGNEMSNNLINGISGAVTGIAGILNEVVSKVNSTISNVNSSLSGIEKAFTFSYDVTTPDGKRRWGKYSMNLPRVNTVPYLAKGAVIPPRSEFLHDALMIAQYYYECGLYVQFTMSLCIEWLFLFVRDDPRYSPPQQKSWYTKCTEEYPEITAMLESEQRSEIIGTLRRMPQNFLFKGLPDDIKDDYKLMDF